MLKHSISAACRSLPCLAIPSNSPYPSGVRGYSSSTELLPFKMVKEKVASTYGWVAYNIISTAAFAGISYQTGVALKIAEFMESHHPLIPFAAIIALTLPPLQATVMIDEKEHPLMKKMALTTSNLTIGSGVMSLMGFLGSEVVIPAALITTGVSSSLALTARHASNEYSLKYKGPLLVGVGGLAASGLCGLAFPGPLAHLAHGVSLYGGLFIFSALLVADVQEMHQRAHQPDYSSIDQSLLIYLDVLNLFSRITELYDKGSKQRSLTQSNTLNETPLSHKSPESALFRETVVEEKGEVDDVVSCDEDGQDFFDDNDFEE